MEKMVPCTLSLRGLLLLLFLCKKTAADDNASPVVEIYKVAYARKLENNPNAGANWPTYNGAQIGASIRFTGGFQSNYGTGSNVQVPFNGATSSTGINGPNLGTVGGFTDGFQSNYGAGSNVQVPFNGATSNTGFNGPHYGTGTSVMAPGFGFGMGFGNGFGYGGSFDYNANGGASGGTGGYGNFRTGFWGNFVPTTNFGFGTSYGPGNYFGHGSGSGVGSDAGTSPSVDPSAGADSGVDAGSGSSIGPCADPGVGTGSGPNVRPSDHADPGVGAGSGPTVTGSSAPSNGFGWHYSNGNVGFPSGFRNGRGIRGGSGWGTEGGSVSGGRSWRTQRGGVNGRRSWRTQGGGVRSGSEWGSEGVAEGAISSGARSNTGWNGEASVNNSGTVGTDSVINEAWSNAATVGDDSANTGVGSSTEWNDEIGINHAGSARTDSDRTGAWSNPGTIGSDSIISRVGSNSGWNGRTGFSNAHTVRMDSIIAGAESNTEGNDGIRINNAATVEGESTSSGAWPDSGVDYENGENIGEFVASSGRKSEITGIGIATWPITRGSAGFDGNIGSTVGIRGRIGSTGASNTDSATDMSGKVGRNTGGATELGEQYRGIGVAGAGSADGWASTVMKGGPNANIDEAIKLIEADGGSSEDSYIGSGPRNDSGLSGGFNGNFGGARAIDDVMRRGTSENVGGTVPESRV